MAFSLDSKVKDILKNPAAAAVLDKYSPDASKNPQMKLVGGLTLRKLASFPQSARDHSFAPIIQKPCRI